MDDGRRRGRRGLPGEQGFFILHVLEMGFVHACSLSFSPRWLDAAAEMHKVLWVSTPFDLENAKYDLLKQTRKQRMFHLIGLVNKSAACIESRCRAIRGEYWPTH